MLVWRALVDTTSHGLWKNGGKRNTIILRLGTAYDVSRMESTGNYLVVFVDGKSMPLKICFMNGSMIEHDGLGITFFSVDILKDIVACWYAWVLKSSCQN